MKNIVGALGSLVGLAVIAVGCAAQPETEPVNVDVSTDVVDERQIVTVNGTTMDALTPGIIQPSYKNPGGPASARARATFSGASARMGVCLLKEWGWENGQQTACSTASQCGSLTGDASVPSSWWRCTWDNGLGTGTKYCFHLTGPLTECAGSPSNGGQPIGPGTYYTNYKEITSGRYISQACYNNCTASDPSASSAANWVNPYEP